MYKEWLYVVSSSFIENVEDGILYVDFKGTVSQEKFALKKSLDQRVVSKQIPATFWRGIFEFNFNLFKTSSQSKLFWSKKAPQLVNKQ